MEARDVTLVSAQAGSADRYAALNRAAAQAQTEWLLFPLGGGFGDIARVEEPEADIDAAATDAGLLVRRRWFESLGGLHEGVLAGGEADLLARLRAVGRRTSGIVGARGAALRTLRRRWALGERPRSPRDAWVYLAADNRVPERRAAPARAGEPALVVFTDAFPERSETFIARELGALRALGWAVRVESSARPVRREPEAAAAVRVDYLEDEPPLRGALDLVALCIRHPLRCVADLVARRRWRDEEDAWPLRALAGAARRLRSGGERHIHVHFAGLAALNAMRLARITGVGYSVAPHGYEVFAQPRNVAAKLDNAAFVAAPCEYTAGEVRALMSPQRRGRVRVVVMGVDAEGFRRATPYPGRRTIVAVGRFVDKKGFADLVEAARLLEGRDPLERLLLVGDGPLRGELERAIAAGGLTGRVEIVDAWGSEPVREVLEGADLLAMPAVIAADGDRDAMPVVVKEALAMEVPVVATDAVGLPEIVKPEWGRLVAPNDPRALAGAISELLALPAEQRAAMGQAGRAHVVEHCDVTTEARKLARLVLDSRE